MGGTLTVENRSDSPTIVGVCFRLSLPLELPPPRGTLLSGPGPGGGSGDAHAALRLDVSSGAAALLGPPPGPAVLLPARCHALVVDDSAMNRRIAERLLRGIGCSCTLAEDGDEVPDAVAREAFDVILMDIHMARVNGDAAVLALRAAGYAGPIVAVTGNATRADAEGYRQAGFNATLGKPFGAAELHACLAGVCCWATAGPPS
jgi:CheY-like chemotaxis protein